MICTDTMWYVKGEGPYFTPTPLFNQVKHMPPKVSDPHPSCRCHEIWIGFPKTLGRRSRSYKYAVRGRERKQPCAGVREERGV